MDSDSRIKNILGDDCRRCMESAFAYMKYLDQKIPGPCRLTGVEAFPEQGVSSFHPSIWATKSEDCTQDNPICEDVFELVELLGPDPKTFDVIARVRRLTDMSVFDIDLSWLKCVDPDDGNNQLVEDYGFWSVNY